MKKRKPPKGILRAGSVSDDTDVEMLLAAAEAHPNWEVMPEGIGIRHLGSAGPNTPQQLLVSQLALTVHGASPTSVHCTYRTSSMPTRPAKAHGIGILDLSRDDWLYVEGYWIVRGSDAVQLPARDHAISLSMPREQPTVRATV
jgi:hypothetical protein